MGKKIICRLAPRGTKSGGGKKSKVVQLYTPLMIFNGNYVFSTISCEFSMLSNCNFAFFFIFCEFSMLSNGKFASCLFPLLFNGNLRIEKLQGRGGDVCTFGRMDVRKLTPVCYRSKRRKFPKLYFL